MFRVQEVRSGGVFGVIIGINTYQHSQIPDLEGCLNDANAMKSFLRNDLRASDNQLLFLVDEAASRDAIISGLEKHLIQNTNILRDDLIIIFFAGHGNRVLAPKGWKTSDGKVETICPYDEGMPSKEGGLIQGIPDLTFNALLRKLRSAKGNNIVVIFDCCHSGGMWRDTDKNTRVRVRPLQTSLNTTPFPDILPDKDLWRWEAESDPIPVSSGLQSEATSSHIVLAACCQSQKAYEDESHDKDIYGRFTYALLEKLRSVDRGITYRDLIQSLTVVDQTPQCVGINKNRLLFNTEVLQGAFSLKKLETEGGRFQVEAGGIHGVCPESEFSVYDPAMQPYPQDRRILYAERVHDHFSILVSRDNQPDFAVSPGAKGILLDLKNPLLILRVFIDLASVVTLAPALRVIHSQSSFLTRVDSDSECDVVLSNPSSGKLLVERVDPLISNTAGRTLSFLLGNNLKDQLQGILLAIAHFRYHLRRWHNSFMGLLKEVPGHNDGNPATMQLYRLTRNENLFRTPEGNNLFVNNVATLEALDNVMYGIEITNCSDHNIFPYLFYFDPSDCSIQCWYHSPVEPPLDNGSLRHVTVGYGEGGGDARKFILDPGLQSDTGFLKLFLSPHYVDLEDISRESIFVSSARLKGTRVKEEDLMFWGTQLAAITVRRLPRAGTSVVKQ